MQFKIFFDDLYIIMIKMIIMIVMLVSFFVKLIGSTILYYTYSLHILKLQPFQHVIEIIGSVVYIDL